MKNSVFLLLFLLSGCAAFGDAAYSYKKTKEGCVITIYSGRNLPAGAEADITNCNLKVKAASLEADTQQNSLIAMLMQLLLAKEEKPDAN